MANGDGTFRKKLNSRKLLITISFEAIAVMLLVAGLIQADHWVTVTITVAGAYLGAQAYVDRRARTSNRSLEYASRRSQGDY